MWPRQTGKTTLRRDQFPDGVWIDLLKSDVFDVHSERVYSRIIKFHPDAVERVKMISGLAAKVPNMIQVDSNEIAASAMVP
ncbi:MAG: hypothetical protein WCI18_01145 [Pseudomonadota bacterium]